MTRLLIISFSDLSTDARLQRQIAAFKTQYEVITAGFGPPPEGVVEHIVLPQPPSGARRRRRMAVESLLLRLRAYRLIHRTSPLQRAAKRALDVIRADVVLANDLDAAPLAYDVVPAQRVHVDLHEFFPGLHDDNVLWARLRGPYNVWLVRRFAARAESTSTVAQEIADRYRQFGLNPTVVTNASRFRDLPVRPVNQPIRLVHSGVALRGRHLETMIEAMAISTAAVDLTLYLMPNDQTYIDRLRARATEIGTHIHIEPPVPHADLIETLAQYDVGIHILPATSTNHRLALPNKFFDFVQARLGVIVGPTPAMANMTERYRFGAVSAGFNAQEVAAVLDTLTPVQVANWKAAAATAAQDLSAERQVTGWTSAIGRLGPGPLSAG